LGPLYRSSIEKGTSINVINSSNTDAKKARGEEAILSLTDPNAKRGLQQNQH
jgi:hypothetical protein